MSNPEYKTLLYEKDQEVPHILYVTLNRPDKNNAISIGENEMTGELKDAMWRANHDDEVKVVIFRGAGKKAAVAIDCYLTGKPYPHMEQAGPIARMDDPVMKWHLRETEKDPRAPMPMLDINERKGCFKEVHQGLSDEEAVREARRCLNCRISSMGY